MLNQLHCSLNVGRLQHEFGEHRTHTTYHVMIALRTESLVASLGYMGSGVGLEVDSSSSLALLEESRCQPINVDC